MSLSRAGGKNSENSSGPPGALRVSDFSASLGKSRGEGSCQPLILAQLALDSRRGLKLLLPGSAAGTKLLGRDFRWFRFKGFNLARRPRFFNMTAPRKLSWLQFRLRTLFLVCFLTAVGVWLFQWTRWPARTLQEFNDLVQQERYEEAAARLEYENDFLVSPDDLVHRVIVARNVCSDGKPEWRSLADFIYGRQTYRVVGNQACFVDVGKFRAHWLIESMTLERGKIRFNWRGPMDPTVRYENGNWVRDEPLPW